MPSTIDVQQWAKAYSIDLDASLVEQSKLVGSLTRGLMETVSNIVARLPSGPGRVRFEVRLQMVPDEEIT